MNRVAVVILNYKGIEDTLHCLESLEKQTFKNTHIVVVENGSNDHSVDALREFEANYTKKIQILINKKNRGFAGGVNTGIRWALKQNFDGIALFNNDAVAEPNWLEQLVKTHLRRNSGITTGLLLHEDGKTIDSTGDWYSTWGLPFPRNRNDRTENAPKAEYVFSASGGASLYTPNLFKEVGLFDETLFAYYEDIDISFRAQLAGHKIYYTPSAVAYHKQGATTKRMPGGFAVMQTFKNLPVVFLKNVPRQLILSVGLRFLLAYILMLGNAIKNGNGKAAMRGWGKSIILISHSLKERHRIQKAKKIPTSYIKKMLWPDLPPDQTGIRKLRKFFTGKP